MIHTESRRKQWRNYASRNRDLCRARNRDWYSRNLDKERARHRTKRKQLYAKNREKVLELNRAWFARNKDKIRQRDLRRRALLKGAKVNLLHMKEWMARIKSLSVIRCYYCDKWTPTKKIHFDHIVPLKQGGPHSVDNLCASCGPCNTSKQAKSISAWVRIGQQTLAL